MRYKIWCENRYNGCLTEFNYNLMSAKESLIEFKRLRNRDYKFIKIEKVK